MSMPDKLGSVPLKMLRHEGEAALKKLQDQRRAHGKVLERACQLAGVSKKEAGALIGVEQNQLSGWFAGDPQAGHPQTWRFEQHPLLGPAFRAASCEADGAVIEVRFQIRQKVSA